MMTLNYTKKVIDAYINDITALDSPDENSYNHDVQDLKTQFVNGINYLRDSYPELYQVNQPDFLGEEDAKALKDTLRLNASHRYCLDFLPTGAYTLDIVNEERIFMPSYVEWHAVGNPYRNFVINYNDDCVAQAKDTFNALMLNMLLCLPTKKVKLNIFDFSMTGLADLFTVNLESELYHDEIITDSMKATARVSALIEHMSSVMKKYGNLVEYNQRKREIAMPYEIVVLCEYPRNYDDVMNHLVPLFENGPKYGVYFVVLNNVNYRLHDERQRNFLDIGNYHRLPLLNYNEECCAGLTRYTPFHRNPLLLNVCFDYLREECGRKEKRAVLKQKFDAKENKEEESVTSEISVTVGLDIENKKEVTLRFNSVDYIHAFILGQSGSGKSVLLNNIITTAINKYAPEDLMLYLMDFKGVEFNRYRGVKHTKAVLVDNSDPQMTLEVLRELKEENNKRVKLWEQERVNNIDGYNRKHPEDRLPQVLFVADECQVMFSKQGKGANGYLIQREIAEIMNCIATQGRSQGIHMLLATQQLDETDISGQVLKNLTECFLLMSAPSDSEKLVPDSSNLTAKQPTGQCCYYHKKELQAQVQTFYATEEELEAAINAAQDKAEASRGNGALYFNGSSMFWLDKQEKDVVRNSSVRYPLVSLGRQIGMKDCQLQIELKQDYSENILLFGANKEEQALGVCMNALISAMVSYGALSLSCDFIVIDCYDNRDSKYRKVLDGLASQGFCSVYTHQESGSVIKQLANDIRSQHTRPTLLAIVGNEKFTEIKRQMPLDKCQNTSNDIMGDIGMDMSSILDLNGKTYAEDGMAEFKTYSQALEYIWDEGPVLGVHTILQVDKPANILFEGEYGKNATDKFRHKVILRSENKYLTVLRFSEDIDVEVLSDEEKHLRAYYYPEDGEPRLFTPFLMYDINNK